MTEQVVWRLTKPRRAAAKAELDGAADIAVHRAVAGTKLAGRERQAAWWSDAAPGLTPGSVKNTHSAAEGASLKKEIAAA
jgi:hypothetical protein